jgi:hypothetical protein
MHFFLFIDNLAAAAFTARPEKNRVGLGFSRSGANNYTGRYDRRNQNEEKFLSAFEGQGPPSGDRMSW